MLPDLIADAPRPDVATRHALSTRCDLGRSRRQLRGVLGARRRASTSASSNRRAGTKSRATRCRIHRRDLARLSAGCDRRPALRLSRLRSLRASARPSFQPQQAAARSVCPRHCRAAALVGRAVTASRSNRRAATCRSIAETVRPSMPKAVVADDSFNWGDDHPPAMPWSDTVIYEAHVRGLTILRRTSAATNAARSPHWPLRR